MFSTHTQERVRGTKTNIVRTRTGCQNCRKRRRKCDEARPECQGCVKRGIKCSGYERTIAFKDVSNLAAESSRKFEAARWAALRAEEEQLGRKRKRAGSRVETLSSEGSDRDGDRSGSSTESSRQYRRPPFTQSTLIDPALYQASPDMADTEDSPPINDTLIIHTSPAREAALVAHYQTHLLPNLPVPMTLHASYMANSCFRHAILALSSISLAYLQTCTPTIDGPSALPCTSLSRSAVGREHYLCAVSELYRLLDLSDPVAREHHAAAALMLAYYEIETGSPFGSLRHAKGLDALLSSKLDLSPESTSGVCSSMPEIYKAWRMLRYDVRYMSSPYRVSVEQTDAHDAYACLDPQLAIRDVYTRTWNLAGRVKLEASFAADPVRGSRSRQAAVWIRDVARRVCDTRNVELGDYHVDEIGEEEIVGRCGRFARALDAWHERLGPDERPVVKVGEGRPFVCGTRGDFEFEPIAVLGFGGGERKAFEYMMYLTARLILSYLMSLYGRGEQQSRPEETRAWANLLFGVVCGMRHRDMKFSYVTPMECLAQAALLSDGIGSLNAVLEGVMPHVLARGVPVAELAEWLYVKKGMEVARRERIKGKSVRGWLLTLDEDYEKGVFDTRCSFLFFGDYNGGRGHFRDVYPLEGDLLS